MLKCLQRGLNLYCTCHIYTQTSKFKYLPLYNNKLTIKLNLRTVLENIHTKFEFSAIFHTLPSFSVTRRVLPLVKALSPAACLPFTMICNDFLICKQPIVSYFEES